MYSTRTTGNASSDLDPADAAALEAAVNVLAPALTLFTGKPIEMVNEPGMKYVSRSDPDDSEKPLVLVEDHFREHLLDTHEGQAQRQPAVADEQRRLDNFAP